MSNTIIKPYAEFVLPASLVSKADVSRLVSEAERVDNDMTAVAVRKKTGAESVDAPIISDKLTAFLEENKISLENSHERSELIRQLRLLKDHVPVIHMTFAVPAEAEGLWQITEWLRKEVNPQAVLSVGLQPALVAGVYLRTPNRIHDLSMRAALEEHRGLLREQLGALRVGK